MSLILHHFLMRKFHMMPVWWIKYAPSSFQRQVTVAVASVGLCFTIKRYIFIAEERAEKRQRSALEELNWWWTRFLYIDKNWCWFVGGGGSRRRIGGGSYWILMAISNSKLLYNCMRFLFYEFWLLSAITTTTSELASSYATTTTTANDLIVSSY